MGKKKDREKQPVAPPPSERESAPVFTNPTEPEEHAVVVAAKQRAKAAEGSVFGQDAARLRRDLFGAE